MIKLESFFGLVMRTAAFFLSISPPPVMSQEQGEKLREPITEESKILSAAASSSEFKALGGRNLRMELLRSGEREINSHSMGSVASSAQPDLREQHESVRPAACAARVIALGQIVDATSELTSDETGVITLYSFLVRAIYKGGDFMGVGKPVSVLRIGGVVTLPEGVIRQIDAGNPPFHRGGEYVLFLRKFEGTTGYTIVNGAPDFQSMLSSRKELHLVTLRGIGRQEMTFSSLDQFQVSIQRALLGCSRELQ